MGPCTPPSFIDVDCSQFRFDLTGDCIFDDALDFSAPGTLITEIFDIASCSDSCFGSEGGGQPRCRGTHLSYDPSIDVSSAINYGIAIASYVLDIHLAMATCELKVGEFLAEAAMMVTFPASST